MAERSPFTTGRHRRTEGYVLLELLISLSVLSVLGLLGLRWAGFSRGSFSLFPDKYLEVQSEALLHAANRSFTADDDRGTLIGFNRYGNASHIGTIVFSGGKKTYTAVIELGGGRLVFRNDR